MNLWLWSGLISMLNAKIWNMKIYRNYLIILIIRFKIINISTLKFRRVKNNLIGLLKRIYKRGYLELIVWIVWIGLMLYSRLWLGRFWLDGWLDWMLLLKGEILLRFKDCLIIWRRYLEVNGLKMQMP